MNGSDEGLIRSDGAWVELLGEIRGHRVVLVDGSGGSARDLLREAGAVVEERSPAALQESGPAQADAVVLAAVALDSRLVRTAASLLGPDGVLLLVAANAASPLAWADRLRGRSTAPLVRLRTLRALAGAAGLAPRAEYGLLRSAHVSSTMFEFQHRAAAARIVAGSNTLNVGLRRSLVDLLGYGVARGHAPWLVGGVAVLCSARALAFEPLTGRIGVLGSEEVKLLYGDPPRYVDKVYASEQTAAAEADALEAVGLAWPGLAPALLERRSPRRRRLGTADGGPGLLHGDFWLGNLLVGDDEERVVGVIDWSGASLGNHAVDLRFLVDTWVTAAGLSSEQATALHAAAAAAFEEGRGRPQV